jgi:DNA-binding MurR/RpiR family transcriptional regulator
MLKERLSSFNPKEQILVHYVIEHPYEVLGMSITELAKQTEISTATISRFCKALHFEGFSAFKIKLSAELHRSASHGMVYQDIVAGNSVSHILQAVQSNHQQSIADTTRVQDIAMLERAVTALHEAHRIDLYGIGTSSVVAMDFHQKLLRIGKSCVILTEPHMQLTSATNLTSHDVAMAISYSGETPEAIEALTCAQASGATLISLTKYGANSLSQLAHIPLFTSSLEAGMRRGDMASRIAQLHLIDILFTILVSQYFNHYVPRLEKTFQNVEAYKKKQRRD